MVMRSGNSGPPAAQAPDDARELAADLVRQGRELMRKIEETDDVHEKMTLYRSAVAACGQAAKIEGAALNIDERKILRSPAWRRLEDKLRDSADELCGSCANKLATAMLEIGS